MKAAAELLKRLCRMQPEAFSAHPAESTNEKVWMNFSIERTAGFTVENGAISHSFSGLRLTVPNSEDCYTFEGLASTPDEIHTTYYYHYKRTILGLKEEARWS